MRSAGIVRRIDDLGRIVIPREIRRRLDLQEGDQLEVYVDKDSIIFKPYYANISDEVASLLHLIEYNYLGDDNNRRKILEILRNARESITSIENKTVTTKESDI